MRCFQVLWSTFSEGFCEVGARRERFRGGFDRGKGVEELERERDRVANPFATLTVTTSETLHSRFPKRLEHSGTSQGFCGIDLRGLVVVVVVISIVSLCSGKLFVEQAPHSSDLLFLVELSVFESSLAVNLTLACISETVGIMIDEV